ALRICLGSAGAVPASVSSFLFQCYGAPRDLHSFPTRRSSDLGPVEHQGRSVAGADRGADLLLVGVVGEELHGEGIVGMVLVPGVEGGLVRVLLRAGQRPDGQARRGAGTTGGLLPASAGAEPGEDGQRQAEAGERRATGGVHHCFLLKTDRHGPKNFRKTTAGPCKLIRLTSAVKISPASNGHDPV